MNNLCLPSKMRFRNRFIIESNGIIIFDNACSIKDKKEHLGLDRQNRDKLKKGIRKFSKGVTCSDIINLN